MAEKRATVTCSVCGLTEPFDKLGPARALIETHRAETGHDATWELHRLETGVERAGEQAGVCGRPECVAADSPLVRTDE